MKRQLYLIWIFPFAALACTFPDELLGTWTTTWPTTTTGQSLVLGTSGSVGSLTSTYEVLSAPMSLTCLLSNDTVFVLKSTATFTVFVGVAQVRIYMCLDVRSTASDDSKYFYLNSGMEAGFGNLRLKGFSDTTTVSSIDTICDTTLDVAEYHILIRTGSENNAAQQCPDQLLGYFWYTFTDGSGTVCDSTSIFDVCNNNLTHGFFNETSAPSTCSAKFPMWSEHGLLSCIVSVVKTDDATGTTTDYVTMYNHDSTVTDSTTYRFTCLAITTDTTDGSTVYLSLNPKDCESGQSPQVRTTSGVLMVLTPYYTCIPSSMVEETDYTVLIIVIVLIFVIFIIAAIILIFLLRHKRNENRRKAREKKVLIHDEHPMGEMSMSLDAPSTLEPVSDNAYLESRDEVYKVPKDARKQKSAFNPLGESSLNLEFKGRSWANLPPRPATSTIPEDHPFLSELDNGSVPAIDPVGSKMARSLRSTKPRPMVRSFTMHNTKTRGLANGDLRRYQSVESNLGMSMESVAGELNDTDILSSYSARHEVKAKTPRSTRSIKTPVTFYSPRKAKTPKPASRKPEPEIIATPIGFVKKPASRADDRTGAKSGARSVTKLGSVTSKSGAISPRRSPRKMKRSKTTIVASKSETEAETDTADGMQDFMNAENLWMAPEGVILNQNGDGPKSVKTSARANTASPVKRRVVTSKMKRSKTGISTAKKKKGKRNAKSDTGGSPVGILSLKARPTPSLLSNTFAKSTTSSQAKVKSLRIKKAQKGSKSSEQRKDNSDSEFPPSALLNTLVTSPTAVSTPKPSEFDFHHLKKAEAAYTPAATQKPWH